MKKNKKILVSIGVASIIASPIIALTSYGIQVPNNSDISSESDLPLVAEGAMLPQETLQPAQAALPVASLTSSTLKPLEIKQPVKPLTPSKDLHLEQKYKLNQVSDKEYFNYIGVNSNKNVLPLSVAPMVPKPLVAFEGINIVSFRVVLWTPNDITGEISMKITIKTQVGLTYTRNNIILTGFANSSNHPDVQFLNSVSNEDLFRSVAISLLLITLPHQ